MITSNARTAPPPPFKFEPEVVVAMEKPLTRESVLAPTLCPTCGAPTGARLMVTHIQALVAAYYKIPVRIMTSARGTREESGARQVAMYLAYELTPKSLPDLAKRFGLKDHTTVLHAIRCTQRRMLEDAEIEADLRALRERLAA
jgi:chromosomal replication initiation ATPase DnaA